MKYVLPIPERLRGYLLEYSRLYAYPTLPEPPSTDGFVLLDSGAFGLSKRGGQMDDAYMEGLANHYQCCCAERIYGIAPDVFLNPRQTLRNWEIWQKKNYPPVIPVFQSSRARWYDWVWFKRQAETYADANPSMIAFSNPSMRQIPIAGTIALIVMIREITGAQWVHNLGAGWNKDDIQQWQRLGCFDSIDSIAYYTTRDSWRGIIWKGKERAIDNAKFANELLGFIPNSSSFES